jgi:hypothetical protein
MLVRARSFLWAAKKLVRGIGDAFRVVKAFDKAAHSHYEDALRILSRLGDDAKDMYDVRLLKGAVLALRKA